MREYFYIYLAGNIKKGKEDENEQVWGDKEMQALRLGVKRSEIVFLNPAERFDDLSDQKSVFGRDMFQVFSSNLVLVDGRGKRGLGVGAEMMFAKMHRIPVVTWVPDDSHYHRQHIHLLGQHVSPWIHPFVYSLSDFIAPSLDLAAQWIDEKFIANRCKIKGPEVMKESIHYYLGTQLKKDTEMHRIVSSHEHFDQKLNTLECVEV
jgi:hypothetical protein